MFIKQKPCQIFIYPFINGTLTGIEAEPWRKKTSKQCVFIYRLLDIFVPPACKSTLFSIVLMYDSTNNVTEASERFVSFSIVRIQSFRFNNCCGAIYLRSWYSGNLSAIHRWRERVRQKLLWKRKTSSRAVFLCVPVVVNRKAWSVVVYLIYSCLLFCSSFFNTTTLIQTHTYTYSYIHEIRARTNQ